MTTKIRVDVAHVASQAEAEAGTDTTKLMTPERTAQAVAAQVSGQTIASQAEAEAGTNNTKMMTPLRSAQAIAALETFRVSRIMYNLVGLTGMRCGTGCSRCPAFL